MLNQIAIIGRLTKNPELRYTNSGKAVCEFTLAVNRIGEGTDFITCTCWGKQAENLVKYQTQGSLVAVSGKLRVNKYTDNNNNTRYKTYVETNELEYLSSKGKAEKVVNDTEEPTPDPFEDFHNEIEDNNLPF